jgi:ubiquinone/menaquinone biosynthesis C-methylase UbiE
MDAVRNAATRFAALSALFDATTTRHLADRGVGPGWQCLEVGGGSGSVAKWLGERVGPRGRVMVTDVETRFLEHLSLPNVEVRRHDITRDALPERAFDLIHTRMVLMHLPPRDQVLAALRSALKPGGWLVCEDFDRVSLPPNPDLNPGEIVLKTHEAMGRVHQDQDVAPQYGRLLLGRLRALGLVDLGAEARLMMAQAGSWSVQLLQASYERRRRAMIDAGYVTEEEFDADLTRMAAPEFMMPSPLMWSVWGRRASEVPCAAS